MRKISKTVFYILILLLNFCILISITSLNPKASKPSLAMATLVLIDPEHLENDTYLIRSLVSLDAMRKYHQNIDLVLLWTWKTFDRKDNQTQLPEKLNKLFLKMNVKTLYVSDDPDSPIGWAYKLGVQGNFAYLRSFAKLELWNLQKYKKIIYVDNDIYIKGSYQALFDLVDDNELAAVWDEYIHKFAQNFPHGHLNYFNFGMFVMTPNANVYKRMMEAFTGEFRQENLKLWNNFFAEQSFMNFYFGVTWKRLPDKYNLNHIEEKNAEQVNAAVGVHLKFPQQTVPDPSLQELIVQDYEKAKSLLEQVLNS